MWVIPDPTWALSQAVVTKVDIVSNTCDTCVSSCALEARRDATIANPVKCICLTRTSHKALILVEIGTDALGAVGDIETD